MIFSVVLTIGLFGLLVYALLQKQEYPIVGHTLPVVCVCGMYLAWFPESTATIAHFVGVGRGVDLMLYVWVLASGILFLVLHLKLVSQDRKLTELVRFLAIQTATQPDAESVQARSVEDGQ